MINVVAQYFSLNRFNLRVLGLWPYEQSRLARVQLILLQSILASSFIFQLMVFVTSICSWQIVIQVCSTAFFYFFCVIKYNSYFLNMDTMKRFLELLQQTYDELRDKNEIAIMDKYWNIGRTYTKILALLLLLDMLLYVSSFLVPILDILPINISQSHRTIHVITEYFIDQKKYSYLIMLHVNAASFIGKFTVLTVGTMYTTYMYHFCGMFMVACYRIEHFMMTINLQKSGNKQKSLNNIGIIRAVDMHRNAMRLTHTFMSSQDMIFFFLFFVGVISASLNLFQVFNELLSGFDIEKLYLPGDILIFFILYFFITNINAQHLTDHSKNIFTIAYNVEWYMAPTYVQKLILFILQRGSKDYNIVIGKVFVGSLEGFVTLMSASISYFTVIYSTQ